MHDGFCILQGDFTNVGITLDDVKFLMAGGSPDAWFPGRAQLGPYYSSGPARSTSSHISLTLYLSLNPFSVTLELGRGGDRHCRHSSCHAGSSIPTRSASGF